MIGRKCPYCKNTLGIKNFFGNKEGVVCGHCRQIVSPPYKKYMPIIAALGGLLGLLSARYSPWKEIGYPESILVFALEVLAIALLYMLLFYTFFPLSAQKKG